MVRSSTAGFGASSRASRAARAADGEGSGAVVTAPLPDEVEAEIRALVRQARGAGGPVMRLLALAGSKAEDLLQSLPAPVRGSIEDATIFALGRCYGAASAARGSAYLPDAGRWGHRAAAMLSGGAGGFGGIGSSVVELPATIAIFFASIQRIAASHGLDPDAEDVRLECLRVFASGSPLDQDDGVDTSFLTARFVLNGSGASALIARIAPRFAAVLGQKLAAQAVPLVGAVTGAGVNLAFIRYYEELAHVRFSLMRLARDHSQDAVMSAFRMAAAKPPKIAKD